MSVRKRNEFLDADESEGELDNGYNSGDSEQGRGTLVARSTKRRRLDRDSDGVESDLNDDALRDETGDKTAEIAHDERFTVGEEEDRVDDGIEHQKPAVSLKASTPKQVAAAQKAARRSGVVYISRVPPFMKPQTLKHFLVPHASKGLGRIFLTPEDQTAHSKRVRNGGNKKKSYSDGWVEFLSKREAKIAVEMLNGNIIGGKKGNFYHDDLWSMKYLKGFKWSHLTEQIANENAEREARKREEFRKTREENMTFLQDFEKGKMLEGMEVKRKAKGNAKGDELPVKASRPRKEFKQKAVQKSQQSDVPSQQASRLHRMIF